MLGEGLANGWFLAFQMSNRNSEDRPVMKSTLDPGKHDRPPTSANDRRVSFCPAYMAVYVIMTWPGLLGPVFELVTKGKDAGKWWCSLCKGRPMKDIRPHLNLAGHRGMVEYLNEPPPRPAPAPVPGLQPPGTMPGPQWNDLEAAALEEDAREGGSPRAELESTLSHASSGSLNSSMASIGNWPSAVDSRGISEAEDAGDAWMDEMDDDEGSVTTSSDEEEYGAGLTFAKPHVELSHSNKDSWYPFKREEVCLVLKLVF